MPQKRKIVFLSIVLAGLIASTVLVQRVTRLQSSAATPGENSAFAEREKAFLTPIYNAYFGTGFKAGWDSAHNAAISTTPNDIGGFYRMLCSAVVMEGAIKGSSLAATDPAVSFFADTFSKNQNEFESIATSAYGKHVVAAPYYDCLLAASISQSVLDVSTKKRLAIASANAARDLYAQYPPEAYNKTNEGDTAQEELSVMASFMAASAELLPAGDPFTGVTQTEKNNWAARAVALIAKGYARCPEASCPLKANTWLVANHALRPSPYYTLGYLNSLSEIGLLYSQLGKTNPIDTPSLRAAVSSIGAALDGYTASNFGFKGPYEVVDAVGNVSPQSQGNYEDIYYTLSDNNDKWPIHSSIPTENIDATSLYYDPPTAAIRSYIYDGDKVWNYNCDSLNVCRANYQNSISNIFQPNTIGNQASAGWTTTPPPASGIDAVTQWYMPGSNPPKLISYIWDGNNTWKYECVSGSCNAVSVATIAAIGGISNAATIWGTSFPSGSVDAVSQYVIPNANPAAAVLKTYVFKGSTVWHYTCTNLPSTPVCNAVNTQPIANLFAGVSDQTAWNIKNPLPAGMANVDSVTQFYAADGATLKTYIFKGKDVWSYDCNNGCRATSTDKLPEFFKNIYYQQRWPISTQADSTTVWKGVSEWGMDATYINGAYTARYLLGGTNESAKYTALLNEEQARNRLSNPPFPSRYSAATGYTHSTSVPLQFYSTYGLNYIADGWIPNDPATGKPYPTMEDWSPKFEKKTNSHWWMNIYAGRNHALAYLNLTTGKIKPISTATPTGVPPTATTAPAPTSCPILPVPTNMSPSGTVNGGSGQYTFTWSPVAGNQEYALRIDDLSNPFDYSYSSGTCVATNAGDLCNDHITGTSYPFTLQEGHTYSWWVHAQNECGYSAHTPTTIVVPAASITGSLDGATCTNVGGWAAKLPQFACPVTVDIYSDGVKIQTTIASQPRPTDVGDCGFNVAPGPAVQDGIQHRITARGTYGTTTGPLADYQGAKYITCPRPTTAPEPTTLQGSFDTANCTQIWGWARTRPSSLPGVKIAILADTIQADGSTSNSVQIDLLDPNHARTDVEPNATVNIGFATPTTKYSQLFDGKKYRIRGVAKYGNITLSLGDFLGPQYITCAAPTAIPTPTRIPTAAPTQIPTPTRTPTPVPPTATRVPNATATPVPAPAVVGYLDNATCVNIDGWSTVHPNNPSGIQVNILSDGVRVGTVVADQFRPELSGNYGYSVSTNNFPSLFDGKQHRIQTQGVYGSLAGLLTDNGGPKYINCPAPTAMPTPVPGGVGVEKVITFNGLVGSAPEGMLSEDIKWGAGQWYISGAWGQFTTSSISFSQGSTARTGDVTFLKSGTIVGFDAYSSTPATITVACANNPTKTFSSSGLNSFTTGWVNPCTKAFITSSNGWFTSIDNFKIKMFTNSGPVPTTPVNPTSPVNPTTPPANPTSIPSTGGSSLQFNGTSQFASSTKTIGALSTFTFETWAKRSRDTGGYETIVGNPNSSYNETGFIIYVDGGNKDCSGASDQFAFYSKNGVQLCSGVTADTSAWHHIAVSRDSSGSTMMFVDGKLRQTWKNSPILTKSSGRVVVGKAGDFEGEYFAGNIDETRISSISRYFSDFTPSKNVSSDSNTLILWKFNERTGQSVADDSGNGSPLTLGAASSAEVQDPTWSSLAP